MVKQCLLGPTISAIPPKKYAERFIAFIKKMVVSQNSHQDIDESN